MRTLSTQIGALNSKFLNVELLGSQEKVKWERNQDGLIIQAPLSYPSNYTHAFRIVLEGYTETDIGGGVETH